MYVSVRPSLAKRNPIAFTRKYPSRHLSCSSAVVSAGRQHAACIPCCARARPLTARPLALESTFRSTLRITFFLEREPQSETAESALSIRASSSDRLHSREDRNPKMLGAVKGTPGVHQDSPARVRMPICNTCSSLNIY